LRLRELASSLPAVDLTRISPLKNDPRMSFPVPENSNRKGCSAGRSCKCLVKNGPRTPVYCWQQRRVHRVRGMRLNVRMEVSAPNRRKNRDLSGRFQTDPPPTVGPVTRGGHHFKLRLCALCR
jgi:hypothetical protein